jgi:GTP-binding protein Era
VNAPPGDREAAPEPAARVAGFAAIVGRPNVGKSTLLNRLVGEKVAIVSPVPQTTRHRIQAVRNVPGRGQIVFLDTPGIHKPAHRMNRRMVAQAWATLSGADVILWVTDAEAGLGAGDRFILERLRTVSAPLFLILNKVDRVRKPRLLPLIEAYARQATFAEIIPISALDGTQCDVLLDRILAALPDGPALFPEDYLTDQPERTLAAEIVREKLFLRVREEVPHAVAVRVDEFREEPGLVRIGATILVEREGQKGILIGRDGGLLKEAGSAARLEMEGLLGVKVFLRLWVQVERGWRDKGAVLDALGLAGPEA